MAWPALSWADPAASPAAPLASSYLDPAKSPASPALSWAVPAALYYIRTTFFHSIRAKFEKLRTKHLRRFWTLTNVCKKRDNRDSDFEHSAHIPSFTTYRSTFGKLWINLEICERGRCRGCVRKDTTLFITDDANFGQLYKRCERSWIPGLIVHASQVHQLPLLVSSRYLIW